MPSPDPRRHKTLKLRARAADALLSPPPTVTPSPSSPPPPAATPPPSELPVKEQAEFERLQREATVSSAFQPEPANAASETTTQAAATADTELNEGGGLYRGVRPEFEGDKNPCTGEVGGPKNEPLRWGSEGDWSYNGKVTDF
ncbi:Succinate dehydrogenase assembly factor 4, mitochondrial [Beauveria bassiana]|nr:Succinate dehydrogenase assembly factor 4, mitochondrial [Beauveria bassiana]KAH8720257.1 Succinate dehydrogenase assembly factor 4, mitochondrial [Beauveria bassiana]